MKQTLRPYQEDAIEAARECVRAGKTAVVLVAPTGAGKTTIASAIARKPVETGRTLLFIAHREELLEQARDRLVADGIGRVGIISASHPTMNAPAQVASVQTLVARASRGLPPGDVIIYDECHHSAAPGWQEVAQALQLKARVMIGLTATPERGDGRGLGRGSGGIFDALVPVSSVRELQRLGHLVPVTTYSPQSFQKALSMDPVAAYLARTPGERCFVFARDVRHAESLTLAFLAAGVQAATIHGQTPWLLRKARLEAFRAQDRQPLLEAGTQERAPLVLVNAYVLTEGVDVPQATHAILARGCGHPGMMLQMVGRVLRSAPGKTRAVFSDLHGITRKRGMGVPEADRVWSLEGRAIALAEAEKERPLVNCPACEATVASWSTDREGWRICPTCRERISKPEPVIVAPTKQHIWGATASPEVKAATLVKYARKAAKMGYKPGYGAAKYLEAFGHWPAFGEAQRAYQQAIVDQGHDPPVKAAYEAEKVDLDDFDARLAELANCG